jgi:spermidine synthase
VLRLLEPDNSSGWMLSRRILAGTYGKPFVLENAGRRSLHFDLFAVQSVMDLDDPIRLAVPYTRKMMSFLLFNDAPNRIPLLGLGGGSLAKFCYERLPGAAVTAIEPNPEVIALRKEFCIPEDDARFRVEQTDGYAYTCHCGFEKDVILVDACDSQGIAPELDSVDFYFRVRARLSERGLFVMNLCGTRARWSSHLQKLGQVFGSPYLWLPAPDHENIVVIAFKAPKQEIDWQALEARAWNLATRFGLDFPRFVRRFAQVWEHGWKPPPVW